MSRVDRIVATFTKTVNSLRKEAGRQHDLSLSKFEAAKAAEAEGQAAIAEHNRAVKIADNLEDIINV